MAGTDSETNAGGSVPQIVRTEDVLGGEPRLEGRRIGVYHVYERYVDGDERPEAIATALDVELAEVLAALAYAFSNPDEMRRLEARHHEAYERADRLTPGDLE